MKTVSKPDDDKAWVYKVSVIGSFSMFLTGFGMLIWMAIAFPAELSSAQRDLLEIADSLWKVSIGAFFGLVVGRGLHSNRRMK